MTEKISLEAVLGALHQLQGHVDQHFLDYSQKWWVAKSALFPEQFATREPVFQDATEITQQYPVISTFSFSDYVQWYSQFFLKEVRTSPELLAHQRRVTEMRLIEKALKDAAPNDPTIYPLIEQPLGTKGRTRTYGGVINRVYALLPSEGNIVVVAKRVPQKLAKLYEEESITHQALCALGYQDRVAEPIALGTTNQVITYPHLQGDLAPLRESDERTKKEHLSTALELLLGMSLDLAQWAAPNKNPHYTSGHNQYIADQLRRRDWTPQYLMLRFVENFLLRNAAAEGGTEPWDAPLEEFSAVLFRRKDAHQLSEEAHQYPTLVEAVQNPVVQQVYRAYCNTFAPRLATLPRLPGHNDFTVDNILAKTIESGRDKRLFVSGLRLHDIGLVNAPFQSYLFDLLVSCQAAPETREELLRETYLKLQRASPEHDVPFNQSYSEFREGYRLVSIDKMLKQAALSYLNAQTHHDHQ